MSAQNILSMFNRQVESHPESVCFRFVEGEWKTLSWKEVRKRVQNIAGGLKKLGVKKGDRVAIYSNTRYEWTLTDLGVLAAGCVVVPIYESNTPEQAQYIIENSESKIVMVGNKVQLEKLNQVYKKIDCLSQIITFDELVPKGKEGFYNLTELEILGSSNGEKIYFENLEKIQPDDDISFVYTSGTTGNPKGSVLTHNNFMAEINGLKDLVKFEPYYESLLFLPLAHILARVLQYFQLSIGFVQCYAESIDRLLDNIATVKPHFMASVPRIFEKIHTRTLQGVQNASPMKKKIFNWALEVGMERARLVLNRQSVPLSLQLKYKLATKLVFSKLHEKLGGRILFFISGGAPLSRDIANFFFAFGFKILEGYGLTETTAAVTLNYDDNIRLGSVGKPLKGVEIKIADDGEILVKGDLVFKGYYKMEEATKEAIDSDGWFHTGDIGEFDSEGFLKITDRKKDLIITAGGKNIAPQNIENLMKTDPYISQFVVHGDKRKFLSALVTLDQSEIEKFAKDHKIDFSDYSDLITRKDINDFIRQKIDAKNKNLAKYETIKKFHILPNDFSVESGELTPTLKVKRKVINQRYKNIFDGFYKE